MITSDQQLANGREGKIVLAHVSRGDVVAADDFLEPAFIPMAALVDLRRRHRPIPGDRRNVRGVPFAARFKEQILGALCCIAAQCVRHRLHEPGFAAAAHAAKEEKHLLARESGRHIAASAPDII